MKTDRKEEIEQVLKQFEKLQNDRNEVYQAYLRLCRELQFLSDPEARPPRFNSLLHALWIAATGDQT